MSNQVLNPFGLLVVALARKPVCLSWSLIDEVQIGKALYETDHRSSPLALRWSLNYLRDQAARRPNIIRCRETLRFKNLEPSTRIEPVTSSLPKRKLRVQPHDFESTDVSRRLSLYPSTERPRFTGSLLTGRLLTVNCGWVRQ